MKWFRGVLPVAVTAAYVLLGGGGMWSQRPEKLAMQATSMQTTSMQTTTQERIETESWWPTMSTVPLRAFAGSDACQGCHKDVGSGATTAMQRAAVTGKDATFLSGKPALTLRTDGVSYFLKASADGIEYGVSGGGHQLSRKLDWVMGAGNLGRTFVYQTDGRWFQSQVTLYTDLHPDHGALDITTGLDKVAGAGLVGALGQPLSVDDARRCFGCHTVHATTPAGFNPLHAEAGLGCEACHGPGQAHVTEMRAAGRTAVEKTVSGRRGQGAIFNPAGLVPVDSVDFCGACHRTFVDATLSRAPSGSTAAVRFQPYRLEQSKCWRATQDARLTCVGCHDPHEPLNRVAASYDKTCVQCHGAGAKDAAAEHAGRACPKAKSECVTCHMPKVNVASMHGDFTDHRIRVARPGEGFLD